MSELYPRFLCEGHNARAPHLNTESIKICLWYVQRGDNKLFLNLERIRSQKLISEHHTVLWLFSLGGH